MNVPAVISYHLLNNRCEGTEKRLLATQRVVQDVQCVVSFSFFTVAPKCDTDRPERQNKSERRCILKGIASGNRVRVVEFR